MHKNTIETHLLNTCLDTHKSHFLAYNMSCDFDAKNIMQIQYINFFIEKTKIEDTKSKSSI